MVPGMYPGEYRLWFLGRQPADWAIGAIVHLLDQERAPRDWGETGIELLYDFHCFTPSILFLLWPDKGLYFFFGL